VRSYIIVLLTLLALGCGKKESETTAMAPAQESLPADSAAVSSGQSYRYQIIEAPEKTFGYDVYRDDAMVIHQPHIPGMPGVKGFAREEQARKAADLMIEKMKKNEMPPTLSEQEIMDIINN
jgi:hypothetical protein